MCSDTDSLPTNYLPSLAIRWKTAYSQNERYLYICMRLQASYSVCFLTDMKYQMNCFIFSVYVILPLLCNILIVYVCECMYLCCLFLHSFHVRLLRILSSGENGCFLLNRKAIWVKSIFVRHVRIFFQYTHCVCTKMLFTGSDYEFSSISCARHSFLLSLSHSVSLLCLLFFAFTTFYFIYY